MFIRDCPTKPVSIIVTENETNLSKSQRDHYLAIMGSLDAQSRLIITDHISYLMDGGCTIISKKNELIPFLESIKVQYDLNQGVMTKFAKNLPDLLMNMGEEIFNVVLASKGYRFLGDFEKFEKNIYAVRDELERFLEDDSIDISYRNRDQLVSSLIKYNVDIYHNASSFFERLKWTIEFGNRFKAGTAGNYWEENDVKVHAETIDEAVDCARWDLGNEHGLLSYRGEGGFMRVYVGIKKSGRQYPRKGDFRAIKIPEDGKRGEELARRSGTEIEDKPDDLPESLNIKHDNLCLCHSHTAPDGMLYFEEELFFETMEERVERKTYSITQAKRALLEIVHPLKKCADNELIHADIKPDNIGYKDNRHMVCDFGIATFLGEVRKLGQANIGSLVGLAPELYKPQDGETPTGHQDIRSEMFSLGVVLFYSVFGEYHYFVPPDQAANLGLDGEYGSIGKTDIHFTPGNGRTQSENKLLDLKKDQEFYSQTIELFRRKTNADRMTNVLQKLLNPDPEQRYQRFDDLITDLKT